MGAHEKKYDAAMSEDVATWCSIMAWKSFLRSSQNSSMKTEAV